MIEKWIKNNLTLKRWRRFKSKKLAVVSSIILFAMVVSTCFAFFISNNKPLYLSYQGNSYFPAFVDYHPEELGEGFFLYIDYKELELSKGDWALWPPFEWDPYTSNTDVLSYPSSPSSRNIMGTDDRGRDVFARLLYGLRYSLGYAVAVWFLSFFIGIVLGGFMGFFGGKIDFLGQRVVEVMNTVPQLYLLLIIISIFQPNIWWLIAISTLFGWMAISYYARAEFLKNRKKEFVEAAKSVGANNLRIVFRHILPNSLSPIITFAPFAIAMNIVGLASLDYLGFGLPVPTPSWGELLNQAKSHFTVAWWLAVFPSGAIFLTLTLLNLVGEGVRDALDPNLN